MDHPITMLRKRYEDILAKSPHLKPKDACVVSVVEIMAIIKFIKQWEWYKSHSKVHPEETYEKPAVDKSNSPKTTFPGTN